MPIEFTTARSANDLEQILSLQQKNLFKNISAETQSKEGFVTVEHNLPLLKQMNEAAAQVLAKDGNEVIGYALVMPQAFGDKIPELQPMFAVVTQLNWQDRPIRDYRFYVMGQICVDERYRGQGIFDGLYNAHRTFLSPDFDLCVTEVAVRNTRSMRAHERVGFKAIHTYRDHLDEWNVVVWNWE
jgi:GNAT superfamily N-acetyltransferase